MEGKIELLFFAFASILVSNEDQIQEERLAAEEAARLEEEETIREAEALAELHGKCGRNSNN